MSWCLVGSEMCIRDSAMRKKARNKAGLQFSTI
jgi:hypothetical protein